MTKKLLSQNNPESSEKNYNEDEKETNIDENSNNSTEMKRRTNNNKKNEYIYFTPLKRIKLNIPMTPKKKRRNNEVNEFNIRGKNLLNMFQLVA